jgi:hypothetical protein
MNKLSSISDLDLRTVTGGYGRVSDDGKHFEKPTPSQGKPEPKRPSPTDIIRGPAPIQK